MIILRNNLIIIYYLDATIIYGITHILVHYNGKVLYDNGLDLCTVEEGDEEQVMPCPISKGAHYYVKELKISSLLPKVCSKLLCKY